MGMYENPSADKFGPPPGQERFEAPKPRTRRVWYAVPATILYFILKEQIHVRYGRGAGVLLLLAFWVFLGIVDYWFKESQTGEPSADGGDPYTPPPDLTR